MLSSSGSRTLDAEKRRALLEAAVEEFAAFGIAGASYNRIIERSGLSKGAVYYYVENKERLYGAVFEEFERFFLDSVGPFPRPERAEDFWPLCRAYYGKTLSFAEANMKVIQAARRVFEPRSDETAGEWVGCLRRRMNDVLEDFVRRGQALGVLRDDFSPEVLSKFGLAVLSIMDSWYFAALNGRHPVERERFQDMVMDLFARVSSPEGSR